MAAINHREHVNTRTRMCFRVTVNTEVALLKEEFDVGNGSFPLVESWIR